MAFEAQSTRVFALTLTAWLLTFNLANPLACGQSNTPQVNVEVTVLNVTAEAEDRILNLVRRDGSQQHVSEIVTADVPMVEGPVQSKTAVGSTKVLYDAPTNSTQISNSRFQQILGIVKTSDNCTVMTSLKTAAPENQEAVKFEGTARPYYVSSETRPGKFGSPVDVPIYQVIEDGIIVKHIGDVTENGIKLNSKIVLNSVLDLNTFTFTGSSTPITIELPTCETRQLDVDLELEKGKLLLVESNYLKNDRETNRTSGTPFASNVPYVNRLFTTAETSRIYKSKMLFVISANTDR